MIKAIAFDPGVTTGFATGEIMEVKTPTARLGFTWGPMLVSTAQAQMNHSDIMNWLGTFMPDYIICERFDFRQSPRSAKTRTGLELISREFIGIINLFVQMNPEVTLVMQGASQAIGGYFTNKRLMEAKLYRKPINKVPQIHANEACKHLLYWYRFGSGYKYFNKEEGYKSKLNEFGA